MKYSFTADPAKHGASQKVQSVNLRVHYKQMSEVGRAIAGLKLKNARAYLQRVVDKKDVIPYRRHTGGKGRHSVAKNHNHVIGSGFPKKASKAMLVLLNTLEKGAVNTEKENKASFGLKAHDELTLHHVQVLRAPRQRRRTYRAHGRIGAYVRSPCHVQIVALGKRPQAVPKAPRAASPSRKRLAIDKRTKRVPEGGGLVPVKA